MWLYVPSATSAFAPEAEGSISASNWQFQALARSATSRGKPSQSRIWFQRWKRAPWLKLLCGAMPEPSTADAGVDSWMASLGASPASRTASPAGSAGSMTSATYGAMPGASSHSRGRGSCSSKTSPGCSRRGLTKSLERSGYGETYAAWASRLREDYSARRRLARRIAGSGSSSSAWPTMRAKEDSPYQYDRGDHSKPRDTLMGASLNWPTPTARDHKDTGNLENVPENALLGRVAANWATPRSTDGEKGGPNMAFGAGGTPLPAQASQWATPAANPANGSPEAFLDRKRRSVARGSTMGIALTDLNLQVQQWPTPTSLSFSESHQPGNSKSYNETMRRAHSLRAPETSPNGAESSPSRRTLNPLFVSWLMGWPEPASTGYGFSVTGLSRWRRQMQSAFYGLATPTAAPPAQPDMFGDSP